MFLRLFRRAIPLDCNQQTPSYFDLDKLNLTSSTIDLEHAEMEVHGNPRLLKIQHENHHS